MGGTKMDQANDTLGIPASPPRILALETSGRIGSVAVAQGQDLLAARTFSHTMRHADLARLPLEEARWELNESKKRLEDKLGREMVGFAYPYGAGALVPQVRRLAREAGYRYDFSIRQGISPWPWDPESEPLKRLLVRGDDTGFDFHLNMTRGKARF